MKIKRLLIVALGFLSCASARAQFDVSLSTIYRTAPQSFSADLDLGVASILWGRAPRPGASGDSPMYGYMRLQASGVAAPDYNGWGYEAQLFPVSFIGLVAGQSFAENEDNYPAYRCSLHLCIGDFREDYTELRLAGGVSQVFAAVYLRTSRMREDNVTSFATYVSPGNSVSVQTRDDNLKRSRLILGYKFADRWSAILMYQKARVEKTKSESDHQMGGVMFTSGNGVFQATLIGGLFKAESGMAPSILDKQNLVSGMLILKWTPIPSVALF